MNTGATEAVLLVTDIAARMYEAEAHAQGLSGCSWGRTRHGTRASWRRYARMTLGFLCTVRWEVTP